MTNTVVLNALLALFYPIPNWSLWLSFALITMVDVMLAIGLVGVYVGGFTRTFVVALAISLNRSLSLAQGNKFCYSKF